jgi:glucose/arabinose dehydrogenase
MRFQHRPGFFLLATLGFFATSTFAGCDGGETNSTSGSTSTQGGGGSTSQGGGGAASTSTLGGSGGGTTSSTGDHDCSPPQGGPPALKLTEIITGMKRPVYLRAAPGDDERLFVVEQTGRIQILKDGVQNPAPFLDITDRVHPPSGADERGLLGLAFHPDYQQNGRFFVYYTEEAGSPGNQVLAEYHRSADPDLADSTGGFGKEVQVLLKIDDFEGNHNGGMLDFSPIDKMLYIGTGDGGGADDEIFGTHAPFGNGQKLSSHWGKLLRIDVNKKEGGKGYGIPPGNLTAVPANNPSAGVLPEIWDYGLRNPWRFAFDPCNGDLYIGDVGQYAWEEVDVEPAGKGNKNYGWVYKEGTHDKYPDLPGNNQTLTPPTVEYSHGGGNCSISGGFVYRGSAIPGLRGRYFYGDYCSGKIWSFAWDPAAATQNVTEHTAEFGSQQELTSFGYDNQGNIYVLQIGGDISRIDAQ